VKGFSQEFSTVELQAPRWSLVLAVRGRPVGVDTLEHAGGLTDLDEVAVRVT
jgi:hypothetical protein